MHAGLGLAQPQYGQAAQAQGCLACLHAAGGQSQGTLLSTPSHSHPSLYRTLSSQFPHCLMPLVRAGPKQQGRIYKQGVCKAASAHAWAWTACMPVQQESTISACATMSRPRSQPPMASPIRRTLMHCWSPPVQWPTRARPAASSARWLRPRRRRWRRLQGCPRCWPPAGSSCA